MIAVQIAPRRRSWRQRRRRAPHVVAVFSFRYDAHLVPALLDNIGPMTDGWVAYDDTGSTGLFSEEVDRRLSLLQAARETGASWALAVDPDERFESGLASRIDRLTRREGPYAYSFALREMYSPDEYRIDGLWGEKRIARLLCLTRGISRPAGQLHLSWSSFVPGVRVRHTRFNIYHLKMIAPQRRLARAALYRHLDPDNRMQAIGYDYLADDAGKILERIPQGREYHPPHIDDGGLWMPLPDRT
jgi:hypothetical protein